jgi:hypothetical protein
MPRFKHLRYVAGGAARLSMTSGFSGIGNSALVPTRYRERP